MKIKYDGKIKTHFSVIKIMPPRVKRNLDLVKEGRWRSSSTNENEKKKTNTKKTSLGQFFTTNASYIIQGFKIPSSTTMVVEPFAGNGDLVAALKDITSFDHKRISVECYDIDPKTPETVKRDTLLNPPDYTDKFVFTNPPYLARNKNPTKAVYDKYNCNDLYKCFFWTLIKGNCSGGIVIVPVNFLSSIRKADVNLRTAFVEAFSIQRVNIFEERVFEDTAYSVCSMLFTRNKKNTSSSFDTHIIPSGRVLALSLNHTNNHTIGGEIYKLKQSERYTITRATKKTGTENITNILLKCIDNNENSRLGLQMVDDEKRFIDQTAKLSARSYATLIITPPISEDKQNDLVRRFNCFMDESRDKYNSLFLAQYRESNTIARKRISFGLTFSICSHLLLRMDTQ